MPPTATGKNVSIVRTVVSSVSSGARRSAKHLIGTLTGHFCIIWTGMDAGAPDAGVRSLATGLSVAIVSVTV